MEGRARKRELRAGIRDRRSRRSEQERAEAAQAIARTALTYAPIAQAKTVAAYAPLPGEPDVGGLVLTLVRRGVTVLLPRITTDATGEPGLEFATLDPTESLAGLTPGHPSPWGLRVPEPSGPTVDLSTCDVILLPALAADERGVRLGQGGGYYDRTLPHAKGIPTVAVLHDDEFLPPHTIPAQPHDARVDAVLTPSRVVRTPNRQT